MPANKDELAFYTVRELAELIRTKQISSVELTRFFLDRLKKYDEQLKCVVTLTEDRALKMAQKADREIASGNYKGLLHGIPYGAKDLFAVKGYPTTWGAMPYKEQMLDYDATVIQKLDQAGAVLLAKMTMGALARGDVWFGGKTRNPWNLEQGSSGSSAGSASAVAAGLLPFALGTETMGSIVSPSTRCGATGLRPTFGRVSRNGAMALSWTMDKVGPICRSVEDCAIVFEVIRGVDGKDPTLMAAPFNYDVRKDPKKLRVGYLKSAFEGDYAFKTQDSLALETMKKLGFELIPIELPESANLRPVLTAESAAAFDELTRSNRDDLLTRQDANSWPVTFRMARFIPAVEYIQANRLRTKLIAEMDEVMQGIDVYLNPSWNGPSLRITNYTGHPCVVVPNGFVEGSPTSITFTGSLFGEADLLSVAKAFQEATEFHEKHPDEFK
jgi:Asp-tRNA(Asn)/Glu-tRNA(Gln) amidotransferase A subunit family amidase